jgi:hypothetical protein
VLEDPVPARAVRAAGPGGDRGRHDRDLLQMVPVRVAVNRGVGQYGAIWTLAFFSWIAMGITWGVGLVLAMRDKPVAQPPPVAAAGSPALH